MMKKYFLCLLAVFFLLLFPVYTKAANVADSLLAKIASEKSLDGRIAIYTALHQHYLLHDTSKIRVTYQEILNSLRQSNQSTTAFETFHKLGTQYWQAGRLNQADQCLDNALAYIQDVTDTTKLANFYTSFGVVHYAKGNYDKSIAYQWKAISHFKLANDSTGIARGYNNLGIVYLKLGELEQALEYHTYSLTICRRLNIIPGIAHNLGNIGIIYRQRGQFDEAIQVYKQSLEINQSSGNKAHEANNWHNIGTLYEHKKEYDKALDHYYKALSLRQEMSDELGMANSYLNIANAQYLIKNYRQAEKGYQTALPIAEENRSKELLSEIHKGLSKMYETTGDLQKALFHEKEKQVWKDSLINEINYKAIKDLEFKYETEKKEKAILALNQKDIQNQLNLSKKNTYLIITATVLVLVILATLLVVLFLRQRQKVKEKINAKEKELDRMKINFFTGITHEFRTPLTLIIDPINSLLRSETAPAKIETFALIKQNSQKLLELVNELLSLSKIEEGKMPLQLQPVDVNEFLKSVLAVYFSLAKSRGIQFRTKHLAEKIIMPIDLHKIEKVITNLLDNAFRFTPEHGMIKLTVDKIEKGHEIFLQIAVKDNGPGISEEEQLKIFEKFYSGGHASDRSPIGFGIGLALTKELVEMHGGTITVKSEMGKGAVFIVTIPAKQILRPEGNASEDTEGVVKVAEEKENNEQLRTNTGEKPLVLIVEDSIELLNHMKNNLSPRYHIKTCKNGAEGYEKARKHIPDLIISDVIMPKKDGISLCKSLKEDEITNHIPVILLTAKAAVEDRLRGLETGADDYIGKPFAMEELVVRMKNLIAQRRKLREKYTSALIHGNHPVMPAKEELFLTKIDEAIEKHLLDASFDVKELTREIGVSRMQLHRKLKDLTNTSTTGYIRNYRLRKAAELLKTTKLTVAEVAFTVGFNKPAYFSESFKKRYNMPPIEFQRSFKASEAYATQDLVEK